MRTRDRLAMASPWLILLAVLGIGLIASLKVSEVGWWAMLVSFLADAILLKLCLKKIPPAPPHVAIPTIWGERKKLVLGEGWIAIFPWFPIFYNVILINVEKKNEDFKPSDVRSSEKAELLIEVSMTWVPDASDPRSIISYINTGGREGVKNILEDVIGETCRQFAISRPWQDCLADREQLATELVIKLTGADLAATDVADMKKRLAQGNGVAPLPQLGIVLNRFNVRRVGLTGELAKVAERVAVERVQTEAEKTEILNIRDRIRDLKRQGLTARQALEAVQTERGKVKKEVREVVTEGDAIPKAAQAIAGVLSSLFGGKGGTL